MNSITGDATTAAPKAAKTRNEPFVAADVGGTYARVALVCKDDDGRVAVLAYRKYHCAHYPDLAALLRTFIDQEVDAKVDRVAVACTGRQIDGVIINTNLAWPVSVEVLREQLNVPEFGVINDFEAIAYATRFIEPDAAVLLTGPETGEGGEGPVVVVGPSNGLGSAVYIPGDPEPTVLSTEGGHISLAPGTAREREVLAALAGRDAYVSYEHVLSGPGLCTLYRVLAGLRGEPIENGQPEEITASAVAGTDAIAVETLRMFCALLGSFVGNLALVYGASGGVYLTGGMLPPIHDFLIRGQFTARFLDKGRMRTFLERVPVRLMEHDQLGVIGAAGWALEHRQK